MGNCCGSTATAPSSPPPAQASYPLETVHTQQPTSIPALPQSSTGEPVHDQHENEITPTSSPELGTVTSVLVRSQDSASLQRRRDGSGHRLSASGSDVPPLQHSLRPEILSHQSSHQYPPSGRNPSRLDRSPSMDPLGARSRPSNKITRTASTSLIPNTHPPTGSLFQPRPDSNHMTAKTQGARQLPPNLQSLLSNDFRYAVRHCPIGHSYYSIIVHRFRILVVGRVRFVKSDRPWTQLRHVSSQRESGKSSLINAVFNVDMSVCTPAPPT